MPTPLTSGTYLADDANLSSSVFHNVNLSQAKFDDVNLGRVEFHNVNMSHVSIRNACLHDFTIEDANFDTMRIEGVLVTEPVLADRFALRDLPYYSSRCDAAGPDPIQATRFTSLTRPSFVSSYCSVGNKTRLELGVVLSFVCGRRTGVVANRCSIESWNCTEIMDLCFWRQNPFVLIGGVMPIPTFSRASRKFDATKLCGYW